MSVPIPRLSASCRPARLVLCRVTSSSLKRRCHQRARVSLPSAPVTLEAIGREPQQASEWSHINRCFSGGAVSVGSTLLKTEAAAPAPSPGGGSRSNGIDCVWQSANFARATIASERTGLSQNTTKTCAIVGAYVLSFPISKSKSDEFQFLAASRETL
ncbi:uncharacterized protein BDZ83DRAFT_749996 [Colletotrichum acutatum]|uniref:Uncharacterized protein n=1 Tax=Glomerella acutata TaxID=27357 RepID=A0AAD8US59_GLOAC|nr:uncharacterized protein BDZ83DRAFT_749996 [Colletotrichum acutatum]KAK1727445.1 hypothetical protein BDZ83DRAFT_749996 [Colletotrichum acutatum]